MGRPVRILLLADTHLGIDLPRRPRITRRRRGHDFAANYARALELAIRKQADVVIHGGDLLFRSRVPPSLVEQALAPLRSLAAQGIPVLLVPGNHERGRIPCSLLAQHPNLHLFDRPRTHVIAAAGLRLALGGFPSQRRVRTAFGELVQATGLLSTAAPIRLLCLHEAVEGARVGPHDFTFRRGADVIRSSDLPTGVAAILSGHIHRHQVLTHAPSGDPLPAPVLYPGSTERTSFAERYETKGVLLLDLEAGGAGGRLRAWRFSPLPTRPMALVDLDPRGLDQNQLRGRLAAIVARNDPDAVLHVRLLAPADARSLPALSAARLRTLAPPSMNLSVGRIPGA